MNPKLWSARCSVTAQQQNFLQWRKYSVCYSFAKALAKAEMWKKVCLHTIKNSCTIVPETTSGQPFEKDTHQKITNWFNWWSWRRCWFWKRFCSRWGILINFLFNVRWWSGLDTWKGSLLILLFQKVPKRIRYILISISREFQHLR